jgi:hypothetical protein
MINYSYTGINDHLILTTIDPDWFWAQVDIKSPDECWPWLAGHTKGGYGTLRLSGTHRSVRANRVALLLKVRQPLGPLQALHNCDNPPCCNNDNHLRAGTALDNMTDAITRRRRPPRKLTSQQILTIRELRAAGELIHCLATEFNVSDSYIRHAVANPRKYT